MNPRIFSCLYVLLIVFALTGCEKEEEESYIVGPGGLPGGGDTHINAEVTVAITNPASSQGTRNYFLYHPNGNTPLGTVPPGQTGQWVRTAIDGQEYTVISSAGGSIGGFIAQDRRQYNFTDRLLECPGM